MQLTPHESKHNANLSGWVPWHALRNIWVHYIGYDNFDNKQMGNTQWIVKDFRHSLCSSRAIQTKPLIKQIQDSSFSIKASVVIFLLHCVCRQFLCKTMSMNVPKRCCSLYSPCTARSCSSVVQREFILEAGWEREVKMTAWEQIAD